MKLFIPSLGDKFRLIEPWTFDLYNESRNFNLLSCYDFYDTPYEDRPDYLNITLDRETVLSVQRIYIRKGQKDYNSVTFHLIKSPQGLKGRFWAKLPDTYNLDVEPIT